MIVLVAVNKSMPAVKVFSNKILQFYNWGRQLAQVFLYNGHKMVVVVVRYQTGKENFTRSFCVEDHLLLML